MKQIIVKSGKTLIEEVPKPVISDGNVLVKVACSCISQGTELAGIKSSGKSTTQKIIEAVKTQPEKIKKGIDFVKKEGLLKTAEKIKGDKVLPIGYSISGVVEEIGKGIINIKKGDRVACAGAGIANHAEYVVVPRNLVMKIPDSLDLKLASTVTLGGIAMQGVRRGNFQIGEYVAVIGLGILGQLSVQLLKASGCRVIAIDIDDRRCKIAKEHGAEKIYNSLHYQKIEDEIIRYTNGYGVDGVIFTAATNDPSVISSAFKMCKRKGRVILVGVAGNKIDRNDLYQKELDFLISTSYGPGRYDDNYELKGIDYPYAYVRWTENRNMEEYLRLLSEGKIVISDLIEKIYPVSEGDKAYEELQSLPEKPIIALFEYPNNKENVSNKIELKPFVKINKNIINVAIIGAGGFAKGMHLPNLKKLKDKYNIYAICDINSLNAKETAKKFGANVATTDYDDILQDKNVDMVMICTRHNLHADYLLKALEASKNVFVEKPLCITQQELDQIMNFYNSRPKTPDSRPPLLMVGFNRRFSPAAVRVKELIRDRQNPIIVNYRVNAGYIPLNNWVHGEEGGGRIIGEACHMFDLFNFFTESEVESIDVNAISPKTEHVSAGDNFVATLKYTDGSVCTLIYTALGAAEVPKEYIEIYCDGKTLAIDDFKELNTYGARDKGWKGVQDKGHLRELEEFGRCILEGGPWPISLNDLVRATQTSFLIDREVRG